MSKLLIGLTARSTELFNIRTLYDFEEYFTYVTKAGALPVMLGTLDKEQAKEMAEKLDGVIITGGADIDPSFYHQENIACGAFDSVIDQTDINIYEAFKELGKPVFGICRGLQIINIAEGGTLNQDIPSANPKNIEHNQLNANPPLDFHKFYHDVDIVEDSKLFSIMGNHYHVNSTHHQSIDKLGEGLRITAYSTDDNIIEAIESDLVFAVQWHPERLAHDEKHLELLKEYLKQCQLFLDKSN